MFLEVYNESMDMDMPSERQMERYRKAAKARGDDVSDHELRMMHIKAERGHRMDAYNKKKKGLSESFILEDCKAYSSDIDTAIEQLEESSEELLQEMIDVLAVSKRIKAEHDSLTDQMRDVAAKAKAGTMSPDKVRSEVARIQAKDKELTKRMQDLKNYHNALS